MIAFQKNGDKRPVAAQIIRAPHKDNASPREGAVVDAGGALFTSGREEELMATGSGPAPSSALGSIGSFRTETFGAWGPAISKQILSVETQIADPHTPFQGQVDIVRFRQSVFADVRASAHRIRRTRALTGGDDERYLKVIWQLSGKTQLTHRDGTSVVDARQWAIYDTSRPYIFESPESAHFQMLLLPIADSASWSWCVDHLMGKPLPIDGAAEVARNAMSTLLGDEFHLGEEGQSVLQESVLALLGTALNHMASQVTSTANGGHRSNLKKLQYAQEFIEHNLNDQSLTPDMVADACGMSRRSLYSAFSSIGATPSAYIMQRRVMIARELLRDSPASRTITDVAIELGFADSAHFSRTFSKHCGLSPSRWRNEEAIRLRR